MNIHLEVGRNIRRERKRADLTLEELAELCDRSPSFLAYIESGKKQASLDTIKGVADALHVPVGKLFAGAASSVPARDLKILAKLGSFIAKNPRRNRALALEISDFLRKISKTLGRRRAE